MQEDNFLNQVASPLRYPGGKGLLADYFVNLMTKNDLLGCRYFEPYAGGAGVALGLLSRGEASEIFLNDADYHIYCFWKAVINHNQEFVNRLNSVEVSILEWNRQREVYRNPKKHALREVAFSTFFLNRCNRSGVIAGAGPIGGCEQSGEWRLDARFNKSVLAARILRIGELRERINVQNMDAIDFLKNFLPRGKERANVLVYCDPPYVSAGNRLYLNFYQKNDQAKAD
ncbi:MAG: DNA adenine methylase [bacterium]